MSIDLRSVGRILALLVGLLPFPGIRCAAGDAATAAIEVPAGSVEGTVTLKATGEPIHGAVVLIVGLGDVAETDYEGRFAIAGVPEGRHQVLAHREHLSSQRQTATVVANQVVKVDFSLELSPVHEEITVTATAGGESTALAAFNSVSTLDSFALARQMAGTLGEVLDEQPGISRRSFGAGSSRPVIRGFDGDRVLIMQDGVRTGDLGSQSGDHGVTLDPAGMERIEVLKGPATLLYGSNAMGGVVNAITPQDHYRRATPHAGARGQIGADAGTANGQAGLNGQFDLSDGRLVLWAGGGARRTSDYRTPDGAVDNSATRLVSGRIGLGRFTGHSYVSAEYQTEDARYGIPFAAVFHGHDHAAGDEEHSHGDGFLVDLDARRQAVRLDLGLRDLDGFVDAVRLVGSYLDWRHEELEIEDGNESVGTEFENRHYMARAEVEHAGSGRLFGKLGLWAQRRHYRAAGEEALAPPVRQDALAVFAYEELRFGCFRVQLGGRVEHNRYDPDVGSGDPHADPGGPDPAEAEDVPPQARPRSFTGFSGSFGVRLDLGQDSALVANLTRSSRAPALEELYNYGPHVGNLAFEVGNPDLERENALGLEVGLKHQSGRAQGEASVYHYSLDGFVFPSFTGEVREGLREAAFLQGDSRFRGFDLEGSLQLHEHLWFNVGAGAVRAELTQTGESLPRIPPLHGRVGLELPYKGFSLRPELVFAADQRELFREETPTDGYAVFGVSASYILAQRRATHIFILKAYNLGDAVYRTHTSFIKDLAPEMGRGVKFTYSLRFF